ncbi:NAD(P)/FAD-dependent oxidoreductase [Aestuariispira insulae]|uniref:Gamma-glutamylputrescine oxidase n=1 Tax=Aestuariispira insulae TaxID=1461337 RepID=A0A3D9H5P0_9PROT|nr:FAD-binding oxidoreductase [Aestuariispira insulae]RED44820.1 gamma-glutamylputrescine oxidase [Aestuariispira insulae]
MTAARYIDTYYRRTITEDAPRPALSDDIQAEICVIGGGLAGLTTALELARKGHDVVVLEARRVAWGASGRNGGSVSNGYSLGNTGIVDKVGLKDGKELFQISCDGVEIVRDNIRNLGLDDAQVVEAGKLGVIRYDDADGLKQSQALEAEKFGYESEFWDRAKLQENLLTDRYHYALFDSKGFHFHPLNYALGLAREFERLGGRIFEDSPMLSVNYDRAPVTVKAGGGKVTAEQIVFCCGGYTDDSIPTLRRALLPIATYVILTEPLDDRLETAVRTNAQVGDDRRAADYYHATRDGRLLWGSRITTRIQDPANLAGLLMGDLLDVYPQLEGVEVDVAWSGLMGYPIHKMPQLGRLKPHAWYCTGFGGHGMNTTASCGQLIANAIDHGDDRYKLFAPFGLSWNFGPLGPVGVQMTYWKYRFDDWRQERAG